MKRRSVKVTEESTDQGIRFVVRDCGTKVIMAEAHAAEPAQSVTIFWPGRTDQDSVIAFFSENCPRTKQSLFNALIFTGKEPIRLVGISNFPEFRRSIPEEARFVRLEHSDPNSGEGVAPDFIVWSRVDLLGVEIDRSSPDYIGVWGRPEIFPEMRDSLAKYITRTHTCSIRSGAALDSIDGLLQHLLLATA